MSGLLEDLLNLLALAGKDELVEQLEELAPEDPLQRVALEIVVLGIEEHGIAVVTDLSADLVAYLNGVNPHFGQGVDLVAFSDLVGEMQRAEASKRSRAAAYVEVASGVLGKVAAAFTRTLLLGR